MRTPKIPNAILIPVLFLINIICWFYIYDDYNVNWVFIYPIYLILAIVFTFAAVFAFSKSKHNKGIILTAGITLLALFLVQRFMPMDNVEKRLVENYYGHLKQDVEILNEQDKAIRSQKVSIVLRDFQEDKDGFAKQVDKIEVYDKQNCIASYTLEEIIAEIDKLIPQAKKGIYKNIQFTDVNYIGFKKRGAFVRVNYQKNHVFFSYLLEANKDGFIWNKENYFNSGFELATKEKPNLFSEKDNKLIQKNILKNKTEEIVNVQIEGINKDKLLNQLKKANYKIVSDEPIILEIPFYEIANLSYFKEIIKMELKNS